MLSELAITPNVFDPAFHLSQAEHGIELREMLRELADNGMIANLDEGDWECCVAKLANEWPSTSLRSDLKRHLAHLDKLGRLVRHPHCLNGHPRDESEWLGLALESHRRVAFDWIIVSDAANTAAIGDTTVTSVRDARSSEAWGSRRRDRSVRMCASAYEAVLHPLLGHARRLEIVDRYLSVKNQRNFRIVELCALALGNRGHATTPGEITLHLWFDMRPRISDVRLSLDEWERQLYAFKTHRSLAHRFRLVAWGRNWNGPRMHDRFLLTNQCGIFCGWGFDCEDESTTRTTTWALLDEPTWTERRTDLIRDIGPYRWLDERNLI